MQLVSSICLRSLGVVAAVVAVLGGVGCRGSGRRTGAPPLRSAPQASVARALNASPQLGHFVAIADHSARFGTGGLVVSGGDLGARGTTAPFLSGSVAMDVQTGVQVQTARNVIAPSVKLGTGVVVGDVQTNAFTGGTGGARGSVTPYVALPALPAATSVTPGSANLTVATGQTVTAAAFSYAAVSVGTGSTLRLPAGTYQVASLSLSSSARLEAQGPVQVRVAGRLTGTSGNFIGPAAGTTLTAKDIRIEVSGINGTNGAVTATPKAAPFASAAPSGHWCWCRTGPCARHRHDRDRRVPGRDVDVGGAGAEFTFQDGFPPPARPRPATTATRARPTPAAPDGMCSRPGRRRHDLQRRQRLHPDRHLPGRASARAAPRSCARASDQCHDAGTCDPATGVCSNPAKAERQRPATTATPAPRPTPARPAPAPARTRSTCTAPATSATTPAPATRRPASARTRRSRTAPPATTATPAPRPTPARPAPAPARTRSSCVGRDQCHDAGTCNPATGACSNPAKANGTACNDGNACTQTDTCQAGACTGANPVVVHGRGPVPRRRHLRPGDRHLLEPAKANGTTCNDGNACTQTDTCQAGACTGANPVVCTAPGPVPRRRHLRSRRPAPARTRARPTARRATTATAAPATTPARSAPAPATRTSAAGRIWPSRSRRRSRACRSRSLRSHLS